MLKYKIFTFILVVVGAGILLPSCNDKRSPGWEYMPDMYRTPHVNTFEPHAIFPDSLSAREPVKGSIPRGFLSYGEFSPGFEGYEQAKANLRKPESVRIDSVSLSSAAKLYGIYCAACHGEKGDGQGVLVQNDKFLGVPSYADRDINEGTIFHVVTFGRGVMGSHAAQVTPTERWLIGEHVLRLRAQLTGEDGGKSEEGGEKDTTADQQGTENDTENTEG